jgi:hypothetical protein
MYAMKERTLLLSSILIIVASLLIVGGNAKALNQLTVYLPVTFRNYCPPLFADDFSDPTSGWPVGDDGNIRYEYLNNEYRILLRNTDWWAGARPGFLASDYNLTVDVRNATGIVGSYGLAFGLSDDWSQFYSLEIWPDGYYGIYQIDDGNWTSLAEGPSNSINTGTTMNRLKIKRDGALIEAYANGALLASVSDGSYTGMRNVGLIVFTYDVPNVDVMFDNFGLYPVTCNQAAVQSSEARRIPNVEIMESMEPGRKISLPNNSRRR